MRFIPSRALAPVGPLITQFVSLEKCESKDPEFQKKYLKLRRKETISIVLNEFARLGSQFVEAEHKISWSTQGFVERQAKFVV